MAIIQFKETTDKYTTKYDWGIDTSAENSPIGLNGATGDYGLAIRNTTYSDRSVQFGLEGRSNFNGNRFILLGTNDPIASVDPDLAIWIQLKDPFGSLIFADAPAIFQVLENTEWLRPAVADGYTNASNVGIAMVGLKR